MRSLLICLVASLACAQQNAPEIVIPGGALLTTPIAGLENTNATSQVSGEVLKVAIGQTADETNATQLTMANQTAVAEGDVLLAKFQVRGKMRDGKPGQVEFYFEKATDPWTKSVIEAVQAKIDDWKTVEIPFRSIATYRPGEAMASIRLAFGVQTIELTRFTLLNYRKSKNLADLQREVLARNTLGNVTVSINPNVTKQRMIGLGGNFTKPRYGVTEPMDAVGEAVLKGLPVRIVRTGLPLNHFAPTADRIVDSEGPALASLQALQRLAKLKAPIVASVWEGAEWLLPGGREQMGRTLAPDKYGVCADLIVQYLTTARDRYGVEVDYFSFNEPDHGVNFQFSGAQMASFVRVLGPKLQLANLKTKIIVADTANGRTLPDYATEILADRSLARYLGPIGFHSWDALSAKEADYLRIAEVGKRFGKEIWCLEAGHDAQLYQAGGNPWQTWSNANRIAQAYIKTVSLTGATTMAYWTYQNDYPLVSEDGRTKYPVFHVVAELSRILERGSVVIEAKSSAEGLPVLATKAAGFIHVAALNTIGEGTITFVELPKNGLASVRIQTESGATSRQVKVDAQGRLELIVPASAFVTLSVGS